MTHGELPFGRERANALALAAVAECGCSGGFAFFANCARLVRNAGEFSSVQFSSVQFSSVQFSSGCRWNERVSEGESKMGLPLIACIHAGIHSLWRKQQDPTLEFA
eukprot:gene14421-biopygen3594